MLAKDRGTTAARLHRLVGFAVLCETLAEAASRGVIPLFFIKGGVAIELRLGLAARATKDLDIGLCAPAEDLLPAFDRALDVGFADFRLRRRGAARTLQNGAVRLDVTIEYAGRPFSTVDVELATANADTETDFVQPIALHELGLAPPRPVPCLSIGQQIGQKIHALTEPAPNGKPNGRARDVLDVLMLVDRLSPSPAELRVECERIFAERAKHNWPIYSYVFPPSWAPLLVTYADQVGFPEREPRAIEASFNDLLARLNSTALLDGAALKMNYEYRFVVLQYAPPTSNPQEAAFGSPVKTQDSTAYQAFENLTNDGWHVHSMLEIKHRRTESPELLVLLERPRGE